MKVWEKLCVFAIWGKREKLGKSYLELSGLTFWLPWPPRRGILAFVEQAFFAFIYGLLSFCFPDTMRASVSVSLSISLSRSLCHSLCLCLCLLSLNNSRLLFGIFSALCSLTHTSLTYTLQSAIDRVKRDARCSMLTKSKRVCFMSVLRFCLGSTGSG